jgi:hypothetical protein
MEISLVPNDQIGLVWGEIEPIINRATELSGGRFSNISVLDECLNGRISVWVVMDNDEIVSVFTVRIVDYPERRSLYVELLAGRGFKKWASEMFEKMTAWGKLNECTHLECGGRKGWERLGQQYGFSKAYSVIEKEL